MFLFEITQFKTHAWPPNRTANMDQQTLGIDERTSTIFVLIIQRESMLTMLRNSKWFAATSDSFEPPILTENLTIKLIKMNHWSYPNIIGNVPNAYKKFVHPSKIYMWKSNNKNVQSNFHWVRRTLTLWIEQIAVNKCWRVHTPFTRQCHAYATDLRTNRETHEKYV